MTDPDLVDTSGFDPVLAKAVEGLTWQQAHDKCRTDPLYGLARMRLFHPERKPEIAATIRTIMNGLGAAKYCDDPLCRRAGTCMTPKVRCFWEHFYVIQRVLFPAMRRKLKEMQPGEAEEPEAPPTRRAGARG